MPIAMAAAAAVNPSRDFVGLIHSSHWNRFIDALLQNTTIEPPDAARPFETAPFALGHFLPAVGAGICGFLDRKTAQSIIVKYAIEDYHAFSCSLRAFAGQARMPCADAESVQFARAGRRR
ncbi:MAG: hypothetical protein JOY94_22975 [Methylobacteriaceae bacterium]|nr:hypothetical protein [Methylobacteriaceae bacterium]